MYLNEMMDEFMDKYSVGSVEPSVENFSNLEHLLDEEHKEIREEIYADGGKSEAMISSEQFNVANATKECLDAIYVASQRLRRMGIDVDAGMVELHRSNMSKIVPLDKADEEADKARPRYPAVYVDKRPGLDYAVLRCGETGKVVKPTDYTQAVISESIIFPNK